jgi:hypothetical protein
MTEIQMQQISEVLKSYRMEFSELAIESALVEDCIGFIPGSAPEPFPEIIAELLGETARVVQPAGGFAIFDNILIDKANKRITIQDIVFNTHAIVTKRLEKSEFFALYACTAGGEITRMASEYNYKGQAVYAYIVDSLGSIIVERAMDIIHQRLKSVMNERGLRITNRYNPGYCDWDIKEQKKLFGLLPDGFCGINLTDSMLMQPIKSVSGIIGIGKEVTYDQYTCNYCKDINCPYRGKR